MSTGICQDCGGITTFKHSVRCRACYMKMHTAKDSRPRCIDCGKVIWGSIANTRRDRCWDCHIANIAKQKADNALRCPQCGGPISTPTSQLCMRCIHERSQKRPLCPQCGVPMGPLSTLCRSCYLKQKRVETLSKERAGRNYTPHFLVQQMPCALCGFHEWRSTVDRIIPEQGYSWDNMIPLCSRCHDGVTNHWLERPAAITLNEIREHFQGCGTYDHSRGIHNLSGTSNTDVEPVI